MILTGTKDSLFCACVSLFSITAEYTTGVLRAPTDKNLKYRRRANLRAVPQEKFAKYIDTNVFPYFCVGYSLLKFLKAF
jgi:hypothetical protein